MYNWPMRYCKEIDRFNTSLRKTCFPEKDERIEDKLDDTPQIFGLTADRVE